MPDLKVRKFVCDRGIPDAKANWKSSRVTLSRRDRSAGNGYGETQAVAWKRPSVWRHGTNLELAMEEGRIVEGFVSGKVKGGLTAMVTVSRRIFARFAGGVRPVRTLPPYRKQDHGTQGHQADRKRNNVWVSRRAVWNRPWAQTVKRIMESLKEGASSRAWSRTSPTMGAFIDLGGIDGLLHITGLAWRRVKQSFRVLTVGDEIEAKILKSIRKEPRLARHQTDGR